MSGVYPRDGWHVSSEPPAEAAFTEVDLALDEPELASLIRACLAFFRPRLLAGRAAVFLAEPGGVLTLRPDAVRGPVSPGVAPLPRALVGDEGRPFGPALRACRTRLPCRVEDLEADGTLFRGSRRGLALPVGNAAEISGTIVLESAVPGAFSPAEVAGLAALAARAHLYFAKARLFEETRNDPRPIILIGVEPVTLDAAFRSAAFDTPVLLRGETGTGKELLARALHCRSLRRYGPFMAVNCGTLRGPLALSELFGHARGAFTDAVQDRPGLLQAADGGTFFLDEVDKLPLDSQALLLRAVESGEFHPLGAAAKRRRVNVRFVAATNVDLEARIKEGAFLPDLYYRIAGVTLRLAPLRERRSSVPRLASRMVEALSLAHAQGPRLLSPDALRKLESYDYPGNIRELQNVVTEAFIRDRDGRIDVDDLPEALLGTPTAFRRIVERQGPDRARDVEAVLLASSGNVRRAAQLYGVSRTRFYALMKALGITPAPFRRARLA